MYHATNQIPGFPAHPHRGFKTITIVKQGAIDHADSLGASGRFQDGDIQWMTAGKGVQHSEMFPVLSQQHENVLELFQIWLNLPKRSKFVEPHYKMLWSQQVPVLSRKDSHGNEVKISVVAGTLDGSVTPVDPTPDSYAADE